MRIKASHLLLPALLAIALSNICVPAVHSEQLLHNTGFADSRGWAFGSASIERGQGVGGTNAVLLSGTKAAGKDWTHLGLEIKEPPINRKLTFKVLCKAESEGQTVSINTFAYDKVDGLINPTSQKSTSLSNSIWKEVSAEFVAPVGTKKLSIWIVNRDARAASICMPSLTLGAPARVETVANRVQKQFDQSKPSIIQVDYKTSVQSFWGHSGVLTFPVPGTYREQVPLTFNISAEPANALISYKMKLREDGRNWCCEATVSPNRSGAIVRWQSLVLCNTRAAEKLPKTKPASIPQVAEWTKSSTCVQSDAPEIQAKANELSKRVDDVEAYARKVIQFTQSNNGTGAKFDSLDAKAALSCGGSCTSRANLGAALLRAKGIPARTVSHMPAWYQGPMYEHWLTEYWHPQVGWVWLETTLNHFAQPPNTLVVLSCSNLADENKSEDSIHLRGIMHGAAYMSGCEFAPELNPAGLVDPQTNTAKQVASVSGNADEMNKLWKAANFSFSKLYSISDPARAKQYTAQIKPAALIGNAEAITRELVKLK